MDGSLVRGLSASECPVCYEGLGHRKIPCSLTCGHTVCSVCVRRLCDGMSHFSCPLCREVVETARVKRNVTLLQLLTQLHQDITATISQSLATPFESIELGRLLDRGASGEVYRGVWQNNDVAIKVFSSGQLSADAHNSFRREVHVMNTLKHPNVVMLLAASPFPPKLAIVMEYVGGGSLYSHIHVNKTPLSIEVIAQLLAGITRGLQYLHSLNILHRDLKSKNVLLTAPPPLCQAKLCDFGLARMRLESATMTGNIGTVHWTAPEVLNCGRYHFSADVYSFGMVVYEIIARSIPFSNLPPPAVIVAVLIRRERPTPPPDSNCSLVNLFEKCTSWDPTERPSVAAVLHDLMSLIPSQSSSQQEEKDSSEFDHTDSLGHVMLDFDENDELLQFLQESLADESEENSIEEVPLEKESFVAQQSNATVNDTVYEDTRGVLSQQELDRYHNRSSSWNSLFNVPNLVPANSLRPPPPPVAAAHNQLTRPHSYSAPINAPPYARSPPSPADDGFKDLVYEQDRELALQIQIEEHKNLLKNDYQLASEIQGRESLLGYRSQPDTALPPPPPLPPVHVASNASNSLPRITQKARQRILLSQVRRSGGGKTSLRHVEPVEKKAFRVGRVVDSPDTEKQPVFTLQKEIANFSKGWLYPVKIQEPESFYPLGKVIGNVQKIVRRVNSQIQSEIQQFSKEAMKHVQTEEKVILPSTKDINEEKGIPEPLPPPVPPPLPPSSATPGSPPSDRPTKFKSRVISPVKKKGAVASGGKKYTSKMSHSKVATIEQPALIKEPAVFKRKMSKEAYGSPSKMVEESVDSFAFEKTKKTKKPSKTSPPPPSPLEEKEVSLLSEKQQALDSLPLGKIKKGKKKKY